MARWFNKKALFAALLVGAMIAVRYAGLTDYISLSFIQDNTDRIQDFIANNYIVAVLGFIGFYTLIVATSLPISNLLSIAAGYFFGVVPAVIYGNIGAVCGALVAYMVFRFLLHDFAMERYGDKLGKFQQRFAKEGMSYLLFMQLLPITPFGVINVLAGISGIPLKTFITTTLIGITPGQIIYAFAGKQLQTITSPGDILSGPVMIAFGLLALLALLPLILRKLKIIS